MILVIGSQGHAKVVIDVIEKQAEHKIAGLIDPFRAKKEETLGYKILGGEEDIPTILKENKIVGGVIAIGDNWLRSEVKKKILSISEDFNFVSCIHPSAQIAKDVKIGRGSVVMAGAIINSSSTVGEHCILNNNSSLDHDSVMNDFSSLAPNATTGGNVKIGKFSAISLGANVINNIDIGSHTVIGAGSLVLSNLGNNSLCFGNPAKVIRKREIGEKYL